MEKLLKLKSDFHITQRNIILYVFFLIAPFSKILTLQFNISNQTPTAFIAVYTLIGLIMILIQLFLPLKKTRNHLYDFDILMIHGFYIIICMYNNYSFPYITLMLLFTAILSPFYRTPKVFIISFGIYASVNILALILTQATFVAAGFVLILGAFFYFSNYLVAVRDARIQRYATFDSLTNLPNRQAAIKYLQSANPNSLYGILLFDIDNFKVFNDVFGHKTGDKVLVRVVQEIQKLRRTNDFMARLSGDEFMLVIHDMKSNDDIVQYAEYITNRFVLKYNDSYSITISSGLIIYPDHSDNPSNLINCAALAMHKAKEYGKNNLHVYTTDLQLDHLQMYDTKKELENALTHNDLDVHFQPIFDSSNDDIIALEALVRWKKEGLLIEAKEFIPHCNDTQILRLIDYFVIDTVCKLISDWLIQTREFPPFSINISEKTFNDGIFIQEIKNRLYHYKVPSRYLIIEITENALLTNHKYSQEVLNELGALGIKIMIDDFGTGYFSLNFLKSLHCDYLKIDPIFLLDLEGSKTNQEIIHSIISLGSTFKRKIIAEGIETLSQKYYLKQLACDGYQGFLFEKPLPINELKRKYLHNIQ